MGGRWSLWVQVVCFVLMAFGCSSRGGAGERTGSSTAPLMLTEYLLNLDSSNSFTLTDPGLTPAGGTTCVIRAGAHVYQTQAYTPAATAAATIQTARSNTLGSSDLADPWLGLYAGAFDPARPALNLVACNDDYTTKDALVGTSLTGGQLYTVLVTSEEGSATGKVALDISAPMTVQAVGTTTQSAAVASEFGSSITVEVRTPTGSAVVAGTPVTFSVPSSGASATLSQTTVTTDANGRASTRATANTEVGAYSVIASVDGGASTVSFTLTNTAGPAHTISVSGNNQTATVASAFLQALAVQVTDAYGHAVPGATVSFSPPATGATATLSATSVVTSVAGTASVNATASSTAGSYSIGVSVASLASTTFSLTNTAAQPSAVAVSMGNDQAVVVQSQFLPITARVVDAYNNPVSGVTLTFSVPNSGPSASLSTSTATTNAAGEGSVTPTANSLAGSYQISVRAAGVGTSASFSLTNLPDAPSTVSVDAGSGQSAKVGAAFTTPLSLVIKDRFGNLISGRAVTFSAPTSGASASFVSPVVITNQLGVASISATAGQVAGSYLITAAVSGVTLTVSFSMTNTSGPATQMTVVSGGTQSAPVGSGFGSALAVRVSDMYGNPTSNLVVTFVPPTSGASASLSSGSTATTNAQGEASLTATANHVIGSYVVTAKLATLSDVTFALTNTAGPATSVSAVSGSPQSAAAGTQFTDALQVRVADQYDNPVVGASVLFAAPSGTTSASLSSTVVTTDSSGLASVRATALSAVGSYAVTASVTGATSSASFALTNRCGSPASIAVVSGGVQHVVVGQAFSAALLVRVLDPYGNRVPGVTVTYTKPSSEPTATLSSSTAVTGAQGEASVDASASNTAGGYSVTANVTGVATPATFALTNDPGPAAAVQVVSGSGQSGVVMKAFSAGLVARVVDAHGNGVPGITVTFAGPMTGAKSMLSPQSVATNAQGQASTNATANSIAGTYQVNVSAAGIAGAATFTLTNQAGAPANIFVTGGGTQSANAGTEFPDPLSVSVTDVYANPVAGANVRYVAPATGATANLVSSTVATDSSGTAAARATAGQVAGRYTVSASVDGLAVSVSFTLNNNPAVAAGLVVVAGNGQSTRVATSFATQLTAKVIDSYGNPVANVPVSFAAPTSDATATLSLSSVTSDSLGMVSVTAQASQKTGRYSVTARVNGVHDPATFDLTNTAAAPIKIQATSGSGQSGVVNVPFGTPLALVVRDAFDNLVPSALVAWTAPITGAGATLSAFTTTTSSTGDTSVFATANTQAGSYSITANVAGVTAPASFELTNLPGSPANIVAKAGASPQTAMVGTAFTLALTSTVSDAYGNPVPNVTVTHVGPDSGANATLSALTAVTNADGQASVTAVANSVAGSYSIRASAPSLLPAAFKLTNSVGPPGSIAAVGNTESTTIVATPFGQSIRVVVRDSFGNPVPGTRVSFSTPLAGASATLSASSSVTDSQGNASVDAVANTMAGSYWVTASVPGTTTPVVFALTNAAAPAALLTITGNATPQSARVTTAFAQALQTVVTDAYGNPVSGTIVTFTAPDSGPSAILSAPTALSNTSGHAVVQATANNGAGAYRVTATAAGLTSVTFDLANLPGDPTIISVIEGGTQSTAVQTAFASSLKVMVRDSAGNAVPSVMVAFKAPTTGASITSQGSTATTGANGQAVLPASANSAAGTYTVTASVAGASTPAGFILTNQPGAVHAVLASSKAKTQTTQVLTPFERPLEVTVVDSFGNPIPGTAVTYVAPPTEPTATLDSSAALTDAQGRASVTADADAITGTYVVTASVPSVEPALFSLTSSAGPPNTIEAVAGSLQSTTVGTEFVRPLTVVVRDAQNNAVPGATVQFSAPKTGASAVIRGPTATTNADGQAIVSLSANTLSGTYHVSVGGTGIGIPAEFTLTNQPGPPSKVTAGTGSTPQSALIRSRFGNDLAVTVADQYGNPVPSTWILFAAPSSGASVVLANGTVSTNSAGTATTSATANAIAGAYSVLATVNEVSSPITFFLTNTSLPCTLQLVESTESTEDRPVVSVVAAGSSATPAGDVRLVEADREVQTVSLVDGKASTALLGLTEGSHRIAAMYDGAGPFESCQSSALSIQVSRTIVSEGGVEGGAGPSDAGNADVSKADADAAISDKDAGATLRDGGGAGKDAASPRFDGGSGPDSGVVEDGSVDPNAITDVVGSGCSLGSTPASAPTRGYTALGIWGIGLLLAGRRRRASSP